jgi:hypothetical protein
LAAGRLRDTFFRAGDFFLAGFFFDGRVFLLPAVLGLERFVLAFFLADITVSLSPIQQQPESGHVPQLSLAL